MYRCLPFHILYLCMKYEVCRLRHFLVIALQQSVDGQTDGQTDRRRDRQMDRTQETHVKYEQSVSYSKKVKANVQK